MFPVTVCTVIVFGLARQVRLSFVRNTHAKYGNYSRAHLVGNANYPLVSMYVCMYVCMGITYSKSMDQPGKVANPPRGQLNKKNTQFRFPVRA